MTTFRGPGASTGRVEGSSRSEFGDGSDQPGTTSISVTRLDGSFVLPDRVQVVEDSGGYLFESIVVPGGFDFRGAEDRAGLSGERWAYASPDEEGEGGRLDELEIVTTAGGGEDRSGRGRPDPVDRRGGTGLVPCCPRARAGGATGGHGPRLRLGHRGGRRGGDVRLGRAGLPGGAGRRRGDGDDGGWPTYLRVISQPASCAWDTPEDMSVASGPWRGVEVGAHRGELREVPASEAGFDEGMVELRMTIGDVLVWAEGNLPADRLIAALASMAPLDISTQPVERSEPPARP